MVKFEKVIVGSGAEKETSEKFNQVLGGKFDRMLFLTATPFQLGHQELIHVLRSFEAVRWKSIKEPTVSVEKFHEQIDQLETALDKNRLAGRHLDRLWGAIRSEMLCGGEVDAWWCRVAESTADECKCFCYQELFLTSHRKEV